jgi:hypothetical protein
MDDSKRKKKPGDEEEDENESESEGSSAERNPYNPTRRGDNCGYCSLSFVGEQLGQIIVPAESIFLENMDVHDIEPGSKGEYEGLRGVVPPIREEWIHLYHNYDAAIESAKDHQDKKPNVENRVHVTKKMFCLDNIARMLGMSVDVIKLVTTEHGTVPLTQIDSRVNLESFLDVVRNPDSPSLSPFRELAERRIEAIQEQANKERRPGRNRACDIPKPQVLAEDLQRLLAGEARKFRNYIVGIKGMGSGDVPYHYVNVKIHGTGQVEGYDAQARHSFDPKRLNDPYKVVAVMGVDKVDQGRLKRMLDSSPTKLQQIRARFNKPK